MEQHSAEQLRKGCWIVIVYYRLVYEVLDILERIMLGQKIRYRVEKNANNYKLHNEGKNYLG